MVKKRKITRQKSKAVHVTHEDISRAAKDGQKTFEHFVETGNLKVNNFSDEDSGEKEAPPTAKV